MVSKVVYFKLFDEKLQYRRTDGRYLNFFRTASSANKRTTI